MRSHQRKNIFKLFVQPRFVHVSILKLAILMYIDLKACDINVWKQAVEI